MTIYASEPGAPTGYGGRTVRVMADHRPRIAKKPKGAPQWQVGYLFHQWDQHTAGTVTIYADWIDDAINGVREGFEPLADTEWVEIVRADKVQRR